jgi:hypothetical protein
MTTIGPIIDAAQLENKIQDNLQKWIGTYLHELEDQEGTPRGSYPEPRSYTRVNNFANFPEDQMPIVLIVSTGLTERPYQEGDGSYTVKWGVTIGLIVETRGRAAVRDLAQKYAAVIRALMVQKGDQEGFAVATEWTTEGYQDVGQLKQRSIAAARVQFAVEVEGVTLRRSGPAEPIPDPADDSAHGDWPVAGQGKVTATITEEAITDAT